MSKFSALANLKKQPAPLPSESTPVVKTERIKSRPVPLEQSKIEKSVKQPQPATIGKYKNPAYVQRTAYIRKTTDRAVKLKLLEQGEEKEFSELIEELLSTWLHKQE